MCLMLHLGSAKPFQSGPPSVDGAVAPLPLDRAPPALDGCSYTASLVRWYEGRPTCSCVFYEQSLPWEPADEDPETVAAFAVLRTIAEDHGALLRIYGCDYGAAEEEPNVHCRVAPRHIRAGMILFSIPFQGGEPPRVLVEIDPSLDEPDKPETLGVL